MSSTLYAVRPWTHYSLHGGSKLIKILTHTHNAFVPASASLQKRDIDLLTGFINTSKRLFVLTGAGISTESGIRDYRSEGVGLYATSQEKPIQYSDFIKNASKRHRYWARNFAGWPIFSAFQPNICHYTLANMEKLGNVNWLVTQNVDSLHSKAGSKKVTELHGTAAKVGCLSCDYEMSRDALQNILLELNTWNRKHIGRQAPDGDVVVPEHEVSKFKMVDCPTCGGILKPKVVFFGDNVEAAVKEFVHNKLLSCDAMLVIGSTLQVYSSFRYILAAKEHRIPIAILNIGETRGDRFAKLKLSLRAGDILPKLNFSWKKNVES